MMLAGKGKAYGLDGLRLYRRDVRPGLCSWGTRGQISEEMNLSACTGLRTRDMTKGEAQDLITEEGGFLGKTIDYVTSSLRSAKDIYLKGGHVTMEYKDQTFRVLYGNTRKVIDKTHPRYDHSSTFLQTVPWESVEECLTARKYAQIGKNTGIYQKNTGGGITLGKYKSLAEIGVRGFLKDVLNNRNGVSMSQFGGYNGLIDFVNRGLFYCGISVGRKLDSTYLSKLKFATLGKVPKRKTAPDLSGKQVRDFLVYVKSHFI